MESKFTPTTGFVNIGEFFVCNCGVPLAKRTDLNQYEIMKKDRGQTIKLKTSVTNGMIRVKCDKCGRGFNYLNVQETMSIAETIHVDKLHAKIEE